MSHIAIDFGTARTKIARIDNDNKPCLINLGREIQWAIPSLFYIPKEGPVLIGDDAQEAFKSDPGGVVRGLKMEIHRAPPVRRNLRKFNRIELASQLFNWIFQECNRQVFHRDPLKKCTLTVPPGFDEFKINCIKEAAQGGGFEDVDTIEEPVSAARSWFAKSATSTQFIAVCDIGGGTSDIALVESADNRFIIYPEIPPQGIPRGGNDIDDLIFDRLGGTDLPESARPGILVMMRQAKERVTQFQKPANFTFAGHTMKITPELVTKCCQEFIEIIIPHLNRFQEKIENVIDINLDEIPLLLVGGGRYIIGLQDELDKVWPADVYSWEESERATVLGALITAGAPSIREDDNIRAYRDFVRTIQVPPETAPETVIRSFLESLNELKKIRQTLPETLAPILDKIEKEHFNNQTASYLEIKYQYILIQKNNEKQARNHYEKAIHYFKEYKNVNSEEIIKECDISIGFNNDFYPPIYLKALVHILKARAHNSKKNWAKALTYIDQYFNAAGPFKGGLLQRGLIGLETDKPLQAADDFSQALQSTPSNKADINNIDLEPYPSQSRLILLHAYACYTGGKINEALEDLKYLSIPSDIYENNQPPLSMLLLAKALRCKLLIEKKDKTVLSLFEEIFAIRPDWENETLNFEKQLKDLPKWKQFFNEIKYSRASEFDDLMKKWLQDALFSKFNSGFSNKRGMIKTFFEIVMKGNDDNPWMLHGWSYIKDDADTLFDVTSVMAEKELWNEADRCLQETLKKRPSFPYDNFASDPFSKKLLSREELHPDIKTEYIPSSLFGKPKYLVINRCPFTLTKICVDMKLDIISKGKGFRTTNWPVYASKIKPWDTEDLGDQLPKKFERIISREWTCHEKEKLATLITNEPPPDRSPARNQQKASDIPKASDKEKPKENYI